MWELDLKEDWALKNWCFQIVVLEKTLENPLDCKEVKWVNLKKISPEYSLEGLTLKLQYFGHLMWRADSLGKILMLGKIDGKRRRRGQRKGWLDSITDSVDSMNMNFSKLQEIMEDRGAWHAAIHGVAKSGTQLSNWATATTKAESKPLGRAFNALHSLVPTSPPNFFLSSMKSSPSIQFAWFIKKYTCPSIYSLLIWVWNKMK